MSADMYGKKKAAKLYGTVTVIWLTYYTVLGVCNDSWCVNGRCAQPTVPPGCVCDAGFIGFYCETPNDMDQCMQSECLNGGVCPSALPPARQACECIQFTGYFCETRVCTMDSDCNGGRCMITPPDRRNVCLECPPEKAGALCQYPFGELCGVGEGICLNDGDCVPKPNGQAGFVCMCTNEYTGPLCGRYVLSSTDTPSSTLSSSAIICSEDVPCLNYGVCEDGACQCLEGVRGQFCEIACNSDSDCENGGTCMADKSSCVCPDGYEGPRCSLGGCTARESCLNGGRCTANICECAPGFSGAFCDIACLEDSDCRNGGTCSSDGDCDCINSFTGEQCQNDPVSTLSAAVIAVSVVGAVLLLILVIILVILLKRCLSKRNSRGAHENGQLELGNRNKRKKSNEYIGVRKDVPPAVSQRPSSDYKPGSNEFPRQNLHVMELLGSGSFATVHRAEAEGIIRKGVVTTVAVKMLKSTATDGDKSDFEKERNMYLTLGTHPNVVTMMGYCTEKEPYFLIMEYLPNGNLQTYLRHIRTGGNDQYFDLKADEKKDYLTPSEIMSFASQIANGMEFLASKSCIHRDLATRNILLGPDLEAKVSDFGLARDIQDSSQYEMKSQGRVPVRWMAPESLLENMYTSKSDVWSFAVLLWELITLGSHPYPGMASKQVIEEVKAGYRLPKPESCSDEIYDMMARCWNANPVERPSFVEICKLLDIMMADANGYLVMADLNRDDYLYLEPSQTTKSINTADDY